MSKKGVPRKMSDPRNMPSSSRSDLYALRQESQQSDRFNNSTVRVLNSSSEEMENSNSSSSGSSKNGHEAQQNNCVRRIFNSSSEKERMTILEQKYTLLLQELEKLNIKYQRLKEKYIFVKQDNDKLQAELKTLKMNRSRDQIVIESSSSEEDKEDNEEELAIEEQKVETKEIQRKTSIASSRKRRAHFRVEYMDPSSQKRVRVVTEMTEEEQTNSSTSQSRTEGQMTGMIMKALHYAMKSKNRDSEDEDSE